MNLLYFQGNHTSELDRARVIALREVGWSFPKIAMEISKSERTCKNIFRQYKINGSHKKKTRKSHNRATTPEEQQLIIDKATNEPTKSADAIKDELSLECSKTTIKRRLNQAGLHGRVPLIKKYLTGSHAQQRYEFANIWVDEREFPPEFWKTAFFMDEKTFTVSKSNKTKIWRPKRAR